MTGVQLLDRLRDRDVTLFVEDDRLRFRAAQGAYTQEMRQAVAEHRAELLNLLTWDAGAADAELCQALLVIDKAQAATWLSAAQRNVLAVIRQQVGVYHSQRDQQLFGAAGWVEQHIHRWYDQHEIAIRGICPRRLQEDVST